MHDNRHLFDGICCFYKTFCDLVAHFMLWFEVRDLSNKHKQRHTQWHIGDIHRT